MLETCLKRSLWEPPDIDIGKLISQAKQHVNARQGEDFLYIFRTSPYIDTLYVESDSDHNPIIRDLRFAKALHGIIRMKFFFTRDV